MGGELRPLGNCIQPTERTGRALLLSRLRHSRTHAAQLLCPLLGQRKQCPQLLFRRWVIGLEASESLEKRHRLLIGGSPTSFRLLQQSSFVVDSAFGRLRFSCYAALHKFGWANFARLPALRSLRPTFKVVIKVGSAVMNQIEDASIRRASHFA